MKYILTLLLAGILFSCQNKPIQLFTAKEVQGLAVGTTLLTVNPSLLEDIVESNKQDVEISIPIGGKNTVLQLQQQDLFTSDFQVHTDKGQTSYVVGQYYVGKIKDVENSLVSLNIQNNEVTGIISTADGDINIGKAGEDHVFAALATDMLFSCETQEENKTVDSLRALVEAEPRALAGGNCVTIDFELTYEIYQQFGGNTTNAVNWFNGLFAGVRSIYLRENLDVKIKTIYLWSTDDSYSDNASTALSQLVTKRKTDPAFTANLTHLVRGQSSSLSGVAYVGTVCVPSYRFGFSAVTFSFPTAPEGTLPPYSWSVNVVTHELGHNLSAWHTHSCNWTGGPIDGCGPAVGYSEGTCATGPIPAKGAGTLMSYCHMLSTVGINFVNGFGPLPGAKIRAGVAACSDCVVVVTPTCTDGIKNGTETGVDCGGTCPSCPSCSDGIKNQNETGVDCGGVCAPCPVTPPTTTPISQGKPASQSSNYSSNQYLASSGNDGNMSNFFHTLREMNSWWQVDLTGSYNINRIQITNRLDCCLGRVKNFKVYISADNVFAENEVVYTNTTNLINGQVIEIPVSGKTGRYIRVAVQNTSLQWFHFTEVKAWGTPTTTPPCVWRDTIYKVQRITIVDSAGRVCR